MPSSPGIHFPTPFAVGRAPEALPVDASLASEYERKRAELGAVMEMLLLLPPRLQHSPPFALEYAALAERKRLLLDEVHALEREISE